MSPNPLDDPSLFLNRELSQLQFLWRVLDQAVDPDTPLLERLRFLGIASSGLDEFFEIRVAGLRQQVAFEVDKVDADGRSPRMLLRQVLASSQRLVAEKYRILNEVLLPQLAAEGIRLVPRNEWTRAQAEWVKKKFAADVQPVLTPMALDPAHPFPLVLNKGLSFIASVEGDDAYGRRSGLAVLQVPRALPRIVRLPKATGAGRHEYTLLSSIVHAHVDELFPGMRVRGWYQFRVTRNSDLWVDEEDVEDLLQAIVGELRSRRYGDAVRLEVADTCSDDAANTLLELLGLEEADLFRVHGPVNLSRIAGLYDLVDRPDLKYPAFVPFVPRRLHRADLFEAIRRADVLLHHPYESFAPVVELVQQAAADPDVLAIRQTLYRTDAEGAVVQALLLAARAGKEVTAVIELRARFDEERNIDLATRLQEAGANVVYGIVGYKTHCKMLLVVRREGRTLRRYVHLGTGNYHAGTVRSYTDFGLLTCDRAFGNDVHKLFLQLTGLGRGARLERLLQAPFTLYDKLRTLIGEEADRARAGKPARIIAKLNSLTEPTVITALYAASQAGVEIDLIVRGLCRLRPGIPGVSDKIRVRSIVGRFLEHSRVFYFRAGGAHHVFLSSADWMERNLFHRVEVAFPITDPRLKRRVRREAFELALADNVQGWAAQQDGNYRRLRPGARKPRVMQQTLLEDLAGKARARGRPRPTELVPLPAPRPRKARRKAKASPKRKAKPRP